MVRCAVSDLFASPEGLAHYQQGTWPAPADMELACGCAVSEGDAIGRHGGEILCEDHLEDVWESDFFDSHGNNYG